MSSFPRASFLVASAVLLGCAAPGNESKDTASRIEDMKTGAGLCAATTEAHCANGIERGVFSSTLACELAARGAGQSACVEDAQRLLDSDGETVSIDFDSLDACLEEQRAGDASDVVSRACMDAFVGHVADAGACRLDEECVSGRCDSGPCGGTLTCQPARLGGAECEFDSGCADGLVCAGRLGAPKSCVAPQAKGDACDPAAKCGFDLICHDGTCVETSAITSRCGEVGVERCVVGDAACFDNYGGIPDYCVIELNAVLGAGDACGESLDVSDAISVRRLCPQDLQCLDGRCALYPGENEPCAHVSWWGEVSSVCRAGLACGADDVCHEAITRGEACTDRCDEGECQDGYCVKPAFGCAVSAPPSEP